MDASCKKPLIVLTGPTAAGKSHLSIKLAKRINGEIISADSMQVYKGMDIGTAKITKEEMCGIKHYMMDILEPDEEFNVMIFKSMADECINEIHEKGRIPIIVGGTGFYIQALLKDISFTDYDETAENETKIILDKILEDNGAEALYEELKAIDPASAASIHHNNIKRVYKALAHHMLTGEKYSDYNEREALKESPYNSAYFVLNIDRNVLYDRINRRVDMMLSEGLVDEVKSLTEKGMTRNMVSMQGLGYKEVISYLDNTYTYEEMVNILKRDTRHFAKRQLTWFKREKDVIWLDKDNRTDDEILDGITDILQEKRIIL